MRGAENGRDALMRTIALFYRGELKVALFYMDELKGWGVYPNGLICVLFPGGVERQPDDDRVESHQPRRHDRRVD